MADNPLAYIDPSYQPANPLTARTPWADAWSFNAPVVKQYLADRVADVQNPQFWTDAAGQWANAVMMGTTAPGTRLPSGLVDVGDVTAHINPSTADIARMMHAAKEHRLRAFHEGSNFAVWPAYDATHAEMAASLGFTDAATNMQLHGRVGPKDATYPSEAGRFSFFATQDPRPRPPSKSP